MSLSKVFSIRLAQEIIEGLDAIVKDFRWYKRNTIIERVLYHVVKTMSHEDMKTLLREPCSRWSKVRIKVERIDEGKKPEAPGV